MINLRLAASLEAFPQPLKQALVAVAGCGVSGVTIDARNRLKPSELSDSGCRQLQHRLDELGLAMAAIEFRTRGGLAEPDRLDERITAAYRVLEFARRLRADVVTFRLGRVPADVESEEYRLLVEVLNDLARHGNHVGTVPAIDAGAVPPEALAALVEAVVAGPLAVDFDPAPLVADGIDPTAAFGTLHEQIGHLRVRDAVREADGRLREVVLGRGEVAWDELLAVIDESGYRGWLTIDRHDGSDRAGDIARAAAWIQAVVVGP